MRSIGKSMSNIKLPKALLSSCENNEPLKARKFIEKDKLGRYSYWFETIRNNYGFELFKNIYIDWDHSYFNRYKEDVLNYTMQNACNGRKEEQKFIIENKIPFNPNSIYFLRDLVDLIEEDKENKIFLNELNSIKQPVNKIFDIQSDFADSITNSFYQKKHAEILKNFFNKDFSQEFKDEFLHKSAIFLDYRNISYWLDNGADIELKSIQNKKENKFWVFNSRNLVNFKDGAIFGGQEASFELLINSCTAEQKSKNNQLWMQTAKRIIEQFDIHSAKSTIRLALKANAEFDFSWFKNENDAAKMIEENWGYGSEKLLRVWTENYPQVASKLIQMVYKQAVLNARYEMCEDLINKGYDPKNFIESQAFKNICENGSMIKHVKNISTRDWIEKTTKLLNSFGLHQKLSENLNVQEKVVKKLKI